MPKTLGQHCINVIQMFCVCWVFVIITSTINGNIIASRPTCYINYAHLTLSYPLRKGSIIGLYTHVHRELRYCTLICLGPTCIKRYIQFVSDECVRDLRLITQPTIMLFEGKPFKKQKNYIFLLPGTHKNPSLYKFAT